MAHTPGPWHACGDSNCSCRQIWSMPNDCPVFTARPDGNALIGMAHHKWGDAPELIYGEIAQPQQQANARLIAAAPELLEALKMLAADVRQYEAWQRPCLALEKAAAAIAKAEGAA